MFIVELVFHHGLVREKLYSGSQWPDNCSSSTIKKLEQIRRNCTRCCHDLAFGKSEHDFGVKEKKVFTFLKSAI